MSQPPQQQDVPGSEQQMGPKPDCGEDSYVGHDRLTDKIAIITGGDSGIGRAVAIAFAREGADIVLSYLDEDEDAKETAGYVEKAGRTCVLIPGNLADPAHCRKVVQTTVERFGRVDVLVNNAGMSIRKPR
jgi:NAD(P)-dependent dehydrogenase (short-subunit alcohol dehydrogenase family)